MITLVKDTISKSDIDSLISWLGTYPRLTKGELTLQLEKKWSDWLGVKYSVFCNSGSSAILLMLQALLESKKIKPKDKVIVPGLAWATDLSSVMQLGLKPIIADVNLQDLSIEPKVLEQLILKNKPKVLLLVSVLGFTPEMDKIVEICKKYNIILLEDACESMGSEYKNKKLGTFGDMSCFSTYYGHHISTIEGGFVSTNDQELYDILISIRSHGWDRDFSAEKKNALRKEWNISDFNSLYTFYYSGFNLRSTDLQAFIGLSQIDKLNSIKEARNTNYLLYDKMINNPYCKIKQKENCFVSNFAYPIISPKREKIVKNLILNNVEVRPLICGSMSSQPFYIKKYGKKKLKNSSIVDTFGFYIPNNPLLTQEEISLICNIINETIREED
jgi:CDP-6-deoxy-D-xylo-4-hexulose-3-dehydrase